MPKFCANLSMMFNEHAFEDRFKAAADAGFKGVEYLFPYAYSQQDLADRLATNGLTQVLFNMPPGDWDKGERGTACLADRKSEFREGVDKAIEYAGALSCTRLHCMAGIPAPGTRREQALAVFHENIAYAAERAASHGITILTEPINHFDMPGFLLNTSKDGIAVLDAVNAPNLKLQYDIYHMQRMEGELAATMARLLPRIGHMQLADNPGRHEPGTGEINYAFLFRHIDAIGYDGWIGCEYRPKAATRDGLGWLNTLTA